MRPMRGTKKKVRDPIAIKIEGGPLDQKVERTQCWEKIRQPVQSPSKRGTDKVGGGEPELWSNPKESQHYREQGDGRKEGQETRSACGGGREVTNGTFALTSPKKTSKVEKTGKGISEGGGGEKNRELAKGRIVFRCNDAERFGIEKKGQGRSEIKSRVGEGDFGDIAVAIGREV